jgi:hypothetical protein
MQYKIELIHVDRPVWASELKQEIRAAVNRHAGDSESVQFDPGGTDSELVLCLGSPALASNAAAEARIAAALQRRVRVLPVVSALANFKAEVPTALHPINGMPWDAPAIAEEVLQHLGLTERDRRVFLSYLRREATPLAHQLYEELHRRRYSVFLDSFEIEHGEWVQDRIEEALQHMSFVLLLYSKSVESSEWVEKEINFALTQRLGLVALAMPDAAARQPFKLAPGDRRIPLAPADLEPDGRLTPVALDRNCLEIEREHADQFRQRRERMIADLLAALGGRGLRVGSQSLTYTGDHATAFVRLNPRPPDARDLLLLDSDCATAVEKPGKRVLVAAQGGYRETRDLTQWICTNLKHEVRWCAPQAVAAEPGILEK